FSFNFIVPKDIAYQYGNGKLSYYASSSTLDASGCDKSITIGGMSGNILNDNEGPNIHLFMNDEKFVNGQTTDENPVLLALVSDSMGINTIGNGIGHDIVAVIDGDSENPMILNDFYETDMNTYKSGVIRYPLSGLSEGNHTLQLKVWDVCNNSSTSSIDFEVVKSSKFIISQAYNYPNPMSEATTFAFVHNQSGKEMNVKIDIFSIDGRLQRTIQKSIVTEGYRTDVTGWDRNDSHGNRLRQGIYIFRMTLHTTDGLTAEKTGKLVIIH
ncbi:MAG TPA: T9SS type A sorting domain-containing protein, partial [Bacteroidales bacterium]|nr:T9SS type A sorting domain-containing protein [Bacteroidales bacterium]